MEIELPIRSHVTKEQRLPKCFKEVEKILRSVNSCQVNYKTILANSRLRGNTHKKVYSMTVNILKNYNYIQSIINKIQLFEKEKYLRREIATVLIYELIFGHGILPGESKIIKTIQLYENDIFYAHKVLQNALEANSSIEINVPRYVRVHTLITTVPYVIKDLTAYGFHQIHYDDDLSEEKYLELVKNLNKGSFLIDFHFKDVLVFDSHANLVTLELHRNGHIFLQDKSSCIPVHVLNPIPGCAVFDACAAPGMKTVHIAAKMKNKGLLIACERDKSRFECLKNMLDQGSVKICKALCKDFKQIDPCDQAYSTIEYILLDPSCSGSGMVNRMDEVTDTENSKNTERLMKLAGFQIILLKHSLKFPSVKRVVYSTCSIHEEENEYVVHEALKAFSGTFKLIPAMPEWSYRGSEKFEFGKLCLRTDPKIHLVNGFFVAVFERIDYKDNSEDFQNNFQNDTSSFKKLKKKSSKTKEGYERATVEDNVGMNLKQECNFSHLSETHHANNSRYIELLNKNGEYLKSSTVKANYALEQNSACAQEIKKKHKKKKREKSKEFSHESNDLNQEIPHEIPHTSALKCSNIKESPSSSPENNDSTHMRITKCKKNEHQNNKNLYHSTEIIEECTEVTKLHKKKKKKKKDKYETANMQPEEKCLTESNDFSPKQSNVFSEKKRKISKLKQDVDITQPELEYDSVALFTKDESDQNKYLKNINYEDSKDFVNTTSSHKKKKKRKEHLEMDYNHSCEMLKGNSLLHSELRDTANIHQSVGNISDNTTIPEEFSDTALLVRKKKKKHKKCSVEKEEM